MFIGFLCGPWDNSPLVYWRGLKDQHKSNPKGFALECAKHFQTSLPQEVIDSVHIDPGREYDYRRSVTALTASTDVVGDTTHASVVLKSF